MCRHSSPPGGAGRQVRGLHGRTAAGWGACAMEAEAQDRVEARVTWGYLQALVEDREDLAEADEREDILP